MKLVAYGILGKTGMYCSDQCLSNRGSKLKGVLAKAQIEFPSERVKIVPLFTLEKGKKKEQP